MHGKSIIFVGHTASLGGAELALLRYLRWNERKYFVHVVVFEEGPLVPLAENLPNVRVHVLNETNVIKQCISLSRIQKKYQCAIISNSLRATLVISLNPYLLKKTIHFLRHEAYPLAALKLKNLYFKYYAYPLCIGFIANSQYTLDTLESSSLIVRGRVAYTISGVDNPTRNLKPFTTPLRILSLSRISPGKGIDILMKAVNLVNKNENKVQLTIAGANLFGQDDYEQKIQELQASSHGAIDLIGNQSEKSVVNLLQNNDVLVAPSTIPEPFGQVLVQGLSYGLLTLGSDAGGAKEIITHQDNGLLVTPGDYEELAESIRWILENNDEVLRIRENGIKRSLDFTDAEMCQLLESCIDDLLN